VVVTQNEDKADYILEGAETQSAGEDTTYNHWHFTLMNRDGDVLLTTHPQKCATLVATSAVESMWRSGRVVECRGLENR
jgi:hypothetical protein